jgi:hypothetical protein
MNGNATREVRLKRSIAALACLLALAGFVRCERNASPLGPADGTARETDFEVIRALLAYPWEGSCPVIAMRDSTEAWPIAEESREWVRGRLPQVSPDAWESYRIRNTAPIPLAGFRCPGRSVVLLDGRSSRDWERLAPGACGSWTVSRPGFSRDGAQAVIYRSVFWAPLAAAGSLVVLERKQGGWVVAAEVMIWIS